ncbi:hypothetical protein TrCOL_g9420 [Triparma columacea]|uniref:Phospholipase/carboxylesterase/thioesterase domain-containing protein n=1 Tax=Triparma columacea TaxID=722753 RepID=A0A9W7LEV0_9STRA|nr:hypothetical protein TrCOL_g9420 [Triparma columacea]
MALNLLTRRDSITYISILGSNLEKGEEKEEIDDVQSLHLSPSYKTSYTPSTSSYTSSNPPSSLPPTPSSTPSFTPPSFNLLTDPSTYSSLVYTPQIIKPSTHVLLVLPGAGLNVLSPTDYISPTSEHLGLPLSLISSSLAPPSLVEGFVVIQPYPPKNVRSFYSEPRSKILAFLDYALKELNLENNKLDLMGFSEGSTLAVELATTRRFSSAIIASYGYTSALPPLAVSRLSSQSLWVFHCASDAVYPVQCSDDLVKTLRENGNGDVRYTRYEEEGGGGYNVIKGDTRGHAAHLKAGRCEEVWEWALRGGGERKTLSS